MIHFVNASVIVCISPWVRSEKLSVHVLFHRLRLHFNFFWRDVGAHTCCPLCLCLGVGLLSELLQPARRKKKR